ncbi:MAG: ribosome biogenesis GTP-binding protein YihA/YsxC [Thermodesulfobacteriota bacterium]
MIIKSAEFVTSAPGPEAYPPPNLPEIAFAGRSNVGKSSLINTLVNRRRLVKTSSTPGRTQLINFFNINDRLMLVDLPGYGYAKVPEAVRRKWGPMIETYLSTRAVLRGVVVIMDIRRIPGQGETDLLHWLDRFRIPAVPVITKADKLSRPKQDKARAAIALKLAVKPVDLILFSAKSRLGKEAVWEALKALTDGSDNGNP